MTDAKEAKSTILAEWDICAGRMRTAKTVEELCSALGFMLMALRPLIERETVSEPECTKRMDAAAATAVAHYAACPANQLLKGNTQTAKALIVQQFPWVGFVGYLIYEIATK